jgi:hypothetical protein
VRVGDGWNWLRIVGFILALLTIRVLLPHCQFVGWLSGGLVSRSVSWFGWLVG